MGRLRARLAKAKEDRQIQRCLSDAQKSLARAAGVCQGTLRKRGHWDRSRKQDNLRSLKRAQMMIESIGLVFPNIDMGDPDLLPESERQIQQCLLTSLEALQQASKIREDTIRSGQTGYLSQDLVRARENLRLIQRAQTTVGSIGLISPGVDIDDPDLVPENER